MVCGLCVKTKASKPTNVLFLVEVVLQDIKINISSMALIFLLWLGPVSASGGSSYGWTGRPPLPIDQNLGLIVAAPSSLPQTLGQVFISIPDIWPHFLYEN